MDRHYRRLARKFYRMLRHPRRQRSSVIARWLGARVFDRILWVPERRSFTLGMAAGLCCAMTPPFTPQMVVAALLCLWRKWNIPISLAMCWLTNIFTLVPQVYVQTRIGLWTLGLCLKDAGNAGAAYGKLEEVFRAWKNEGGWEAMSMLRDRLGEILVPLALPYGIGVVVTMLLGIVVGYLGGHLLWGLFAHRVAVKHSVPHRDHEPPP